MLEIIEKLTTVVEDFINRVIQITNEEEQYIMKCDYIR